MHIVIDIPEESYKATCNGCMLPPDVENVVQGIKNGTPLQKDQYKILQQIESYHAKATALGYIQKPLAWALYQVWQEVDKVESEEV